MGEVYRARDARLQRDVALKVLPGAVATDGERLARFRREAQVLASLNHPNIAAIYGIEEHGPTQALVLELVDGPTLAERIAQGPIPLDEALPLARQMAEALDAAHEHGVVHRDLKPANIKVSLAGAVKVLDFGLAKALEPPGAASDPHTLSLSPTMTSPAMMTGVGVILGTAAYMAPEQARGRAVDKRADVWAFGVVLFEMLSGRRPFDGTDVAKVLASVIRAEVPWDVLPLGTPRRMRALLGRCLEKDPKRRLRDIGDAFADLQDTAEDSAVGVETTNDPAAAARAEASRRRERWQWAAVLLTAVVGAAAGAWMLRPAPVDPPETRLEITAPPALNIEVFALSPDGRSLVYQAVTEGVTRLWLRSFDSDQPRLLEGTEGATYVAFSPDSASVLFTTSQYRLKRLDLARGAPRDLFNAQGFGIAWGADGTVIGPLANTAPLMRAAADGSGAPTAATQLETGHASHRMPRFLPDGRRFLFVASGTAETQGLYLGSLGSPQIDKLAETDSLGVFVAPDWVLFGRQGQLFAQRLDPERRALIGEPMTVSDSLAYGANTFAAVALTSATNGTFAYRRAADSTRELVWVDRAGRDIRVLLEGTGIGRSVELSPSTESVAVERNLGVWNIWLADTTRGVLNRLTTGTRDAEGGARWSRDGARIAYNSPRRQGGGVNDLYVRSVLGGTDETLLESPANKIVNDWSPDGRFVLYRAQNRDTATDLEAIQLDGDRKPFPVVNSMFREEGGRFSPDGRWICFDSNEAGTREVFVRRFPGPARSWRVSSGGGAEPRWRSDGREIFFLAPGTNRVMAVPVTLGADDTVTVGTQTALFSTEQGTNFDVAPGGQRFLLNRPKGGAQTPPITVVFNWKGPR
jgi:Tol biopolymer transport system component